MYTKKKYNFKSLILFKLIDCLKVNKQKHTELMNTSVVESYEDLPIMKFIDKTERSVTVASVDSNNTFWVLFVHDSINVIISYFIFYHSILVNYSKLFL